MDQAHPDHPGLTFAEIDLAAESGPAAGRRNAWAEAVSRGFHEPRLSDDMRRHWLDAMRADRSVAVGAWTERPVLGDGSIPVATFSHLDKDLNVGGRRLPARLITDITVAPSHRRRGLLRTLMTDNLAGTVATGIPIAVLTASEGTIYGRFGFGLATQLRAVEVDTSPGFALRGTPDDGQVALLEPAQAITHVEDVFARFHDRTRGSVGRPAFYRTMLSGEFDFDSDDGGSADTKLRVAVHADSDGRPDGYCAYKYAGRPDGQPRGPRGLKVSDLVAVTPAAYLALWRFLGDVDLVDQVRWPDAPVSDPLEWALVDPFRYRVTRTTDLLWVRVLDVPAALAARPWGADGTIAVGVRDALGHTDGTWRVTTTSGTASVARTDEPADVALDVESLGALYLGGVTVPVLAAAGRVDGPTPAVERFAAIHDTGPAPYCLTGF